MPPFKVIPNSEYIQWKSAVRDLDRKQLGAAFVDAYDHIDPWWAAGVYHWAGVADAQGALESSISILLIGPDEFADLCAARKVEVDLKGYDWTSGEPASLYWATLLIGHKYHAPYLFRSVCKSLLAKLPQGVAIDKTFCITASHSSQLMMLRHHAFEQAGMYKRKFPILAKPLKNIPILSAFLTPYKGEL